MAGGTTMAEHAPRMPQTMSIQKGFCEKATRSANALNVAMPVMNMALRPSRSASCPRASWRAPATRLGV